jgi:diguanylate cyclase (GGDEF)-like protein
VRIAISSAAMTLLLVQPVAALIAALPGGGRRARMFAAACLVGVGVVTLARAIWTIHWGPTGNLLAPDFFQFSSIMLFAVFVVLATLGVVWIEIEELQADLARLAMLDPLTAILNRRAFMLECERELSRCVREDTGLALAIFDLDHFKDVNDTHGHLVGDQVLRQVVDTLRASLRGHDVIGRYGGEEFMVVLPETHVDQAIVYAERLRSNVEHFGRERQKTYPKCTLTISVGVTALLRERDDLEQVIHRVDHALYAAKARGRNRVCVD